MGDIISSTLFDSKRSCLKNEECFFDQNQQKLELNQTQKNIEIIQKEQEHLRQLMENKCMSMEREREVQRLEYTQERQRLEREEERVRALREANEQRAQQDSVRLEEERMRLEEERARLQTEEARVRQEQVQRAQQDSVRLEEERMRLEEERARLQTEEARVRQEQEQQELAFMQQRDHLAQQQWEQKAQLEEVRGRLVAEYVRQKNEELEHQESVGRVLFEDVIGLDGVKLTVQAQKATRKTQNIFAYGPPGCGKTFISKAIATVLNYQYIVVEGRHLVADTDQHACDFLKKAFSVARMRQPCILFFDEFDTVLVHAHGTALRGELMAQLDGLLGNNDEQLMCIAITNRPWDIDSALRRRFYSHFYFPLPTAAHRRLFLEKYLSVQVVELTADDLQEYVQRTEMFSFKELRDVVTNIEEAKAIKLARLVQAGAQTGTEIISSSSSSSSNNRRSGSNDGVAVDARILRYAVNRVRPQTTAEEIARYENFTLGFGVSASDVPDVF